MTNIVNNLNLCRTELRVDGIDSNRDDVHEFDCNLSSVTLRLNCGTSVELVCNDQGHAEDLKPLLDSIVSANITLGRFATIKRSRKG